MRPELRNFILDYQENVAKACRLLRERLHLMELGPFCWGSPRNSARGWLDEHDKVSYYFHGIGCCVKFDKIVVDFDFGLDGRYDGFDAWRLSLFAESVPQYAEFADDDLLNDELALLLSSGELVKHSESVGSHLMYFAEGLDSKNP